MSVIRYQERMALPLFTSGLTSRVGFQCAQTTSARARKFLCPVFNGWISPRGVQPYWYCRQSLHSSNVTVDETFLGMWCISVRPRKVSCHFIKEEDFFHSDFGSFFRRSCRHPACPFRTFSYGKRNRGSFRRGRILVCPGRWRRLHTFADLVGVSVSSLAQRGTAILPGGGLTRDCAVGGFGPGAGRPTTAAGIARPAPSCPRRSSSGWRCASASGCEKKVSEDWHVSFEAM